MENYLLKVCFFSVGICHQHTLLTIGTSEWIRTWANITGTSLCTKTIISTWIWHTIISIFTSITRKSIRTLAKICYEIDQYFIKQNNKSKSNTHVPVGTHRPPFWQADCKQGLNRVVVVRRVSQHRPINVEGHWHRKDVPCEIHVPPFWQGFGWHGVAAYKRILRFIKNKILVYESHLPGASQRLPVNVNGQLQRNPAPFVTHWPPFKPKHQYLSVYLKIQISSFTWIYSTWISCLD